MKESSKLRVAIIGAGIAGAELVRNALPGPYEITLIEPKDQIECQALFPEYIAGTIGLEDITAPLKPFCDRLGAELLSERAVRLEKDRIICDRSQVNYDIAVLATGAAQNYFGISGANNTFSANNLDGARKAKEFLERKKPEKIVIIGAGLTGIEIACTLSERTDADICILEAKGRIIPQFSENVTSFIEKVLSKKEIGFITSARVRAVGEDRIDLSDGSSMPCDMAIWTAGIKPYAFLQGLDFAKKNGEWVLTDPYLRVSENVFAMGDSAWIEIGSKVASKTAVEAEHQAKHTAKNLHRLAAGKPLEGYSIVASTDAQVALISLGCGSAVGVYGNLCVVLPLGIIHSMKSWIDKSFIERFKQ